MVKDGRYKSGDTAFPQYIWTEGLRSRVSTYLTDLFAITGEQVLIIWRFSVEIALAGTHRAAG